MITAEEFLHNKFPEFEDLDNGNIWLNIENTMNEYSILKARYYVKEALKQASEKALYDFEIEDVIYKDSILLAYPLENIK